MYLESLRKSLDETVSTKLHIQTFWLEGWIQPSILLQNSNKKDLDQVTAWSAACCMVSCICTTKASQPWLAALQPQLTDWSRMAENGRWHDMCLRSKYLSGAARQIGLRSVLHKVVPRPTTPLWDSLDGICALLGICTGTQKAWLPTDAALD